ncbi:MAG TPA: hypothetical protein VLN49_20905 [Gemmatimonadaceae bacterium]|nr:hypothetical protein [Gemmatimonadaceae bacterium]
MQATRRNPIAIAMEAIAAGALILASVACSSDTWVSPTSPGSAPTSAPSVVSLDVTPQSGSTVALGTSFTFTAVAVRNDGRRVPATALSWTSLDPTILAVDPVTGRANALREGSVTVLAQADGVSKSIIVNVRPQIPRYAEGTPR